MIFNRISGTYSMEDSGKGNPVPTSNFCPRCGEPSSGHSYCGNCGLQLSAGTPGSAEPVPGPPPAETKPEQGLESGPGDFSSMRRVASAEYWKEPIFGLQLRWFMALWGGGWAFVFIVLALTLGLQGVPSDGETCLNASSSEVSAYVDAHKDRIPEGVSTDAVKSGIEDLCRGAAISHTPQSFEPELVDLGVTYAGG